MSEVRFLGFALEAEMAAHEPRDVGDPPLVVTLSVSSSKPTKTSGASESEARSEPWLPPPTCEV